MLKISKHLSIFGLFSTIGVIKITPIVNGYVNALLYKFNYQETVLLPQEDKSHPHK